MPDAAAGPVVFARGAAAQLVRTGRPICGDRDGSWGRSQALSACAPLSARFLYSWESGTIASNDAAVSFLEGTKFNLDLDLIKRALHCRNQGSDLTALFPERSKLTAQRDAVLTQVAL